MRMRVLEIWFRVRILIRIKISEYQRYYLVFYVFFYCFWIVSDFFLFFLFFDLLSVFVFFQKSFWIVSFLSSFLRDVDENQRESKYQNFVANHFYQELSTFSQSYPQKPLPLPPQIHPNFPPPPPLFITYVDVLNSCYNLFMSQIEDYDWQVENTFKRIQMIATVLEDIEDKLLDPYYPESRADLLIATEEMADNAIKVLLEVRSLVWGDSDKEDTVE